MRQIKFRVNFLIREDERFMAYEILSLLHHPPPKTVCQLNLKGT